MEPRLSGKVAIVTGSGQGIGKGIALRLAREGADVAVAEFNAESAKKTAAEIEGLGRRALACPVDISDVAKTTQMAADVVAHFGHIDILINNAGVVQTKPMIELTEEDWDRITDLNVRGTFFCLQTVAQQMIRQIPKELREASEMIAGSDLNDGSSNKSWGKIVNLASIAGRRGRPLSAHYAASKASVISITQSAAMALAPFQINVNAISPGIVDTPMWEGIDRDRGRLSGLKPGEAMAEMVRSVPLKRVSTPEDLAGAAAFLCSPDADYITGQTLNVDGGFEMN
jgi:NAD(P)-dependent dehydrogenase (short-subunit alcohol dehydrogenase family)